MRYDEQKALHAVSFIEQLRHTKGAFHGQPFHLLDWQREIINALFGTLREDRDVRQYTTGYVEIPKKKS